MHVQAVGSDARSNKDDLGALFFLCGYEVVNSRTDGRLHNVCSLEFMQSGDHLARFTSGLAK